MWMQTDGVWGSCHLKTGHPRQLILVARCQLLAESSAEAVDQKTYMWSLQHGSFKQASFSAAVARMGIAKEPGRRCMVFYLSVASEDTQHHLQHILQVEVVPRMFLLKQRRVKKFADEFKIFCKLNCINTLHLQRQACVHKVVCCPSQLLVMQEGFIHNSPVL